MEHLKKELGKELERNKIMEAGYSLNDDEISVEVNGFENYYISDYGKVFSTKGKKLKLLKIYREKDSKSKGLKKYYYVYLYKKGKRTKKYIHMLVAEAFSEKPYNPDSERIETHHIKTYSYDQENEVCNRADNVVLVTSKVHSILNVIEKIGIARRDSSEPYTYYENPYHAFKQLEMTDYQFYEFIMNTACFLQRGNTIMYCTHNNRYCIEVVSRPEFNRIVGDIRKINESKILYICDNIPVLINDKMYIVPFSRPVDKAV